MGASGSEEKEISAIRYQRSDISDLEAGIEERNSKSEEGGKTK
jgi:hypothetical protein